MEAQGHTARRRPFYGWFIVGGYFIAGVVGSGTTLWGFQVFYTPMSEDLGWSRGQFTSVLMFRALLMGVATIFMGRLMDKPGWPPIVMSASALLLGASVVLLSTVNSYWQYFVYFVILGGLGFGGAGGILYQALVPKWFLRMRGRAIAYGSAGTAVGAFIYPTFANLTIDAVGWRWAWVIMGVTALVLLLPISMLVRRAPEDRGLLPDGDTEAQVATRREAMRAAGRQEEHSFTTTDALRHRTTWFIVLAGMLAAPTMVGLTANWVLHFENIGFERAQAASIVSIYGSASIVSRLIWGYFLDRFHVRSVAIAHAVLTAGTLLFLLQATTYPVAVAYGFTQGLVLGGYLAIQPLIWANFYGRHHLGAIRGTFMPFNVLTQALAPFAIASSADAYDSYKPAFFVLLAFWLMNAVCMALAKPLPRPREHQPEPSSAG